MTVLNPPHAGGGLTKAEVEAIATAAAAGKITGAEATKLVEEALAKTEAKESPLVKATTANTVLNLATYNIFPLKLEHDTELEIKTTLPLTSVELRVNLNGHKLTGVKLEGGAAAVWIPGPEPAWGTEGEQFITLIVCNGATELLGLTGAKGAAGERGPVGLEAMGAWAEGTTYKIGQWVSSKGSSYVCVKEGKGHEPPNAEYWTLLAEHGAEGGAELAWEAVESLNAKVEAFGTEVEGEHYPAIRCAVNAAGIVFLQGVLKIKENLAAKAVVFKLPAAMRPKARTAFLVCNLESATTPVIMVVKTNGECFFTTEVATTKTPSLSGCTFPKGP